MNRPTDEQYRKAAQHTTIMSDDDLEVDPDAEVFLADDGAWVQCWVWVYDSECEDHG